MSHLPANVHPRSVSVGAPASRLIILILLSLLLVGYSRSDNSPASAIERVLQADQQTNVGVKHFSKIVPRMRQIDTTGCPHEFRAAYLAHIHACEEVVQIPSEIEHLNSNDRQFEIFWESAIRSFLGDVFTVPAQISHQLEELDRKSENAQQEVAATYRRLEEIAVGYGAKLLPKPEPPAVQHQ